MSQPEQTTVHVIPALRYADAAKAIDWLCEAFGFERQLVVPGEQGAIAHAQLTYGNGMLMLGSGGHGENAHDRLIRPRASRDQASSASLYVVVEDVDAHCERARAAGAEIVMEPRDEDYGGRGYCCLDPEGHVWSFGSYDPNSEHAGD